MPDRVLVVEDEDLVRQTVVDVLTHAGFQVDEADTGDDAAKMIDADGYSLILTDINMPGRLDGIDLAAHARSKEPGLPIVFFSGRPDSLARAAASGNRTAVIRKPYSPEAIIGAVRDLLSGKN